SSRAHRSDDKGGMYSLTHARNPRQFTIGRAAIGANALGALAVGAFAIGALAIGRLVVGRLTVGKANAKSVSIEDLTIGRLQFRELTVTDSLTAPTNLLESSRRPLPILTQTRRYKSEKLPCPASGEQVRSQEIISELPLRIILRGQFQKIVQLFIPWPECSGRHREQLAPVGPRLNRR